jgi:sugar phosphate isomerase/epimerase
MKLLMLSIFVLFSMLSSMAQKITNQFFVLHNIIRGDSTYNTFDKQVAFIQKVGFDGVEINQLESFEGMKAALDKHQFHGAYFYVKINLDEPHIDQRLPDYIKQLKGTNTIVAPFIVSDTKKYSPSTHEADTVVVRLLREVGGWAQASGLQVAIYPHVNFYVERTHHALSLVQKINLKNVGLTFNLCHWLATTNSSERETLKPHLKELIPYLKMITINGANAVVTSKQNPWDDYILLLGDGSFDTYGLLKYVIKDLKFNGPVGIQCYNIKGDKPLLVQSTMTVCNTYKTRLAGEK